MGALLVDHLSEKVAACGLCVDADEAPDRKRPVLLLLCPSRDPPLLQVVCAKASIGEIVVEVERVPEVRKVQRAMPLPNDSYQEVLELKTPVVAQLSSLRAESQLWEEHALIHATPTSTPRRPILGQDADGWNIAGVPG